MNRCRDTEKHLICGDRLKNGVAHPCPELHSDEWFKFWGDRYIVYSYKLASGNDEYWRFKVFDLVSKETKLIRFRKSGAHFYYFSTFMVGSEHIILVEGSMTIARVSFIKLEWAADENECEFYATTQIEHRVFGATVITDPLNPSNFVLKYSIDGSVQFEKCRVVSGKLDFGNIHKCFSNAFYRGSKLIHIGLVGRSLSVGVYNMESKKSVRGLTELLPVKNMEKYGESIHWQLVSNRIYACAYYEDSKSSKVYWADTETLCWNFAELETKLGITHLHFFDNSLILWTKKKSGNKSKVKFYDVPIRRPHSLRKQAWISVVRLMKRRGEASPYKAVSKYLPFNSDMRPMWFVDKGGAL